MKFKINRISHAKWKRQRISNIHQINSAKITNIKLFYTCTLYNIYAINLCSTVTLQPYSIKSYTRHCVMDCIVQVCRVINIGVLTMVLEGPNESVSASRNCTNKTGNIAVANRNTLYLAFLHLVTFWFNMKMPNTINNTINISNSWTGQELMNSCNGACAKNTYKYFQFNKYVVRTISWIVRENTNKCNYKYILTEILIFWRNK